jgi:hypothetical protein
MSNTIKCPHCGNTDRSAMESNGCDPRDEAYTMLCLAKVADGDESYDEQVLEQFPEHRGVCGNQWDPNDCDGAR